MSKTTRRHADDLLDAIHQATWEELTARGYAGVTFEGVARRARTSKPVLYRRYRSRAHLVFDAVSRRAILRAQHIDTGSLRGDLLLLLERAAGSFQTAGVETFRGLLGESDDDLMRTILKATNAALGEALGEFIARAQQRGELGPVPVPDRIVMLPTVLIRHEVVFQHPFDPGAIPELLDVVYLPLLRQVTSA